MSKAKCGSGRQVTFHPIDPLAGCRGPGVAGVVTEIGVHQPRWPSLHAELTTSQQRRLLAQMDRLQIGDNRLRSITGVNAARR
jgi:hypothetical protein